MNAQGIARIEYSYQNARPAQSHKVLAASVKSFLTALPATSRLLDLGCGNGSFTAALAQPDWHVCGVDVSASGIEQARSHFPHIQFRLADITENLTAHYPAESFDAILCAEVIEHVYAPRSVVQNCMELLAPGGFLVITTPYHGYLKNLALAITGNMDRHWNPLWDGGHIKFWSRSTLGRLLYEAGFQITGVRGVGRCPYMWKSIVVKATKRPGADLSGKQQVRP